MVLDKIKFGTQEIKYSVIKKSRRTLQINVEPEGDVVIVSPLKASSQDIQKLVRKRALWILKQKSFFQTYCQKHVPKEYISGETHRYLGKQYRLKVIESDKEQVLLKGSYIQVFVKNRSNAKILLENWYLSKAKILFNSKVDKVLLKMEKERIRPSQIKVRVMRTRWGSCTPSGNIILHPALIKAPMECLEYVIVHELCHLKYMKHDKRFYNLLEKHCPNYIKRKDKLNKLDIL